MNLIQILEQEEIARLGKTIPEFALATPLSSASMWLKVAASVCRPTKAL
jgi:hypothetical protein